MEWGIRGRLYGQRWSSDTAPNSLSQQLIPKPKAKNAQSAQRKDPLYKNSVTPCVYLYQTGGPNILLGYLDKLTSVITS